MVVCALCLYVIRTDSSLFPYECTGMCSGYENVGIFFQNNLSSSCVSGEGDTATDWLFILLLRKLIICKDKETQAEEKKREIRKP